MIFVNATDLKLPKRPFRSDKTMQSSPTYRELRDSIRERGILVPLLVEKQGKKYLIIDGLLRYHASIEVGRLELPVEVVK